MKIKHHIGGNWNYSQVNLLKGFNITINEGIDTFQIEENDLYFSLKDLFVKWKVLDVKYPVFTKKELKDSLLSAKNGSHTEGYPMPDMDDGYLDLTYNLENYCSKCGIGKMQKDSFRLKKVPKEEKKKIFELGWIDDELFVEKKLYKEIFKPLGIKSRMVLKYKKEIPFDTHVQLILQTTKEELEIDNNPIETCKTCRRWKYQPMPQGFYPQYKNLIAPIFKSKEYFGSGASANKRIFITKELRNKLIDLKIEKEQWYIPTK